MNAVAHLSALCAIDSTSSLPNRPVVDYLQAFLERRGFACARHPYVDARGQEKLNLVARAGPPGDVELALVGHTDCVPYDPAWTEALTLTAREEKLFARGACDTKGFIACALAAVEGVELSALQRPLALLFTADEEVGCLGAKQLAGAAPFRVKYAIVGEPTQLQPIRANKGYCLAEIEFVGQEGHSAYPERGTSAIRAAGRFLAALDALDLALRAQTDVAFAPPFTTTNVGLIQGGKAKNIIPGSCTLTLEWRPVPSQDPALVREQVRAILEGLQRDEPGLQIRYDPSRLDRGFATAPESRVVEFIAHATNLPSGTVAFGTEGPQLAELGAEVVVFGPGDIRVAHRTGEFVPAQDLVDCTRVLTGAIAHFCA